MVPVASRRLASSPPLAPFETVVEAKAETDSQQAVMKTQSRPSPPRTPSIQYEMLLKAFGSLDIKTINLNYLPPHARLPSTVTTIEPEDSAIPTAQALMEPTPFFLSARQNISTAPADDPTYKFGISSLHLSTNSDSDILQPSSTTPQDLIFSIVLTNSPASFELEYISILIPFNSKDANNPECLMEDYTGPGGYMIMNLRFDVVCSLITEGLRDSGKKSLKVDVMPRTHKQSVPLADCKDLSFLLAGVVVADVLFDKELRVPVTLKFAYREPIVAEILARRC